jgi:hypothetical protein
MTTLPTGRPGSPERSATVAKFLSKLQPSRPPPPVVRGRLIFALDATASREPIWDHACRIQR